ncbi:MAG: hypothetical protein AB7S86_03920 [Hydrogenophaga sp.]|uniref:hypothetical protein n=1 Tax=Hydrogenophaga sp. TaxID=1904254 RepID=UPI003D0C5742
MSTEHGVLTRQLAGLQRRVETQMRASQAQLLALEGEVLRLRTQLVLTRTCVLWGLNAMVSTRPLLQRRTNPDAALTSLAEASGVICQTGCVGHAHPWLEADGQCRRTGGACNQVTGYAEEPP